MYPHKLRTWLAVANMLQRSGECHMISPKDYVSPPLRSRTHRRYTAVVNQTIEALDRLDASQLAGVFKWNSVNMLRVLIESLKTGRFTKYISYRSRELKEPA